MSCPNGSLYFTSKPPARPPKKQLIQKGPILLPNLSPRPALDEDKLSSPEFREALQVAKESKSNDNRLPQNILPSHSRLPSNSAPLLHDLGDHARRMQTRVAVRDNLKSPHLFQIVPLHKVKRLRVDARPILPPDPFHRPSTSCEKHLSPVAPELHRRPSLVSIKWLSKILTDLVALCTNRCTCTQPKPLIPPEVWYRYLHQAKRCKTETKNYTLRIISPASRSHAFMIQMERPSLPEVIANRFPNISHRLIFQVQRCHIQDIPILPPVAKRKPQV
jgi:hypothetical protein